MQFLSVVGTAAMIWVGGGIVIHGLAGFGLDQIDHLIEGFAHSAEELLPQIGGLLAELTVIVADLVFGILLGLILIPIMGKVIGPALRAIRGLIKREA
jgi:predicted DNA repair protein MutK